MTAKRKLFRSFPIGTMVKWMDVVNLSEKYGIVVSYSDFAMGIHGRRSWGLNVFVDGNVQVLSPGRCKSISRPYVKYN